MVWCFAGIQLLSISTHAQKTNSTIPAQLNAKLRVLILSDIEADPDDSQSLIRFLLYANQFDIEGIVATTSIHQKARVSPESIIKILQVYNKVQPNLLKHEKGIHRINNVIAFNFCYFACRGLGYEEFSLRRYCVAVYFLV